MTPAEQVGQCALSALAQKDAEIESLRQQLAASQAREQQLRGFVETLWQIIDDVDTYGDMAKSDDKLYRAMVERRQKDRWKTGITTDGYILALPQDTTALEAMIAKAGEVMRERCAKELFPDITQRMAAPFRALPGVTMEDLQK